MFNFADVSSQLAGNFFSLQHLAFASLRSRMFWAVRWDTLMARKAKG
jgi:hypothetical protein